MKQHFYFLLPLALLRRGISTDSLPKKENPKKNLKNEQKPNTLIPILENKLIE